MWQSGTWGVLWSFAGMKWTLKFQVIFGIIIPYSTNIDWFLVKCSSPRVGASGKGRCETTRSYCVNEFRIGMTLGRGWTQNIIRCPTVGVWSPLIFPNGVFELVFLSGCFGKATRNKTRNLSFSSLHSHEDSGKRKHPPKMSYLERKFGEFRWIFSNSYFCWWNRSSFVRSLKAVLLSWLSIVFAGKKGNERVDSMESMSGKCLTTLSLLL